MELKEPRPKKNNLLISQPLPLTIDSKGDIYKFTGHFDGFSVKVCVKDEMKALNTMGCFGKANFSRGYPTFMPQEDQTQFLRSRVFNQRCELKNKFFKEMSKPLKKVLVVPDSDDENEDYFTNLVVQYQFDRDVVQEQLHLSLEEAFFLASAVGCLSVYSEALLTDEQLWEVFGNSDSNFIQNYVAYYYFRSKNWVVKPGIKFGGDFLLYKDGPPFYHASYLVIIDVLDSKTLERRIDLCRRSMDILNVCGLNRLCETVGKELLICQLLWPSTLTTCEPNDISKISINEVILKRWISSQNRELDDL